MAVEAIQQVTELERTVKQEKEAAAAESKQRILEAQRTVEEASELAQLIQASAGREVRYCLLVCHKSAQEAVLEALRDFGWSKVSLNGWTGTARENDARLDRELSETRSVSGRQRRNWPA